MPEELTLDSNELYLYYNKLEKMRFKYSIDQTLHKEAHKELIEIISHLKKAQEHNIINKAACYKYLLYALNLNEISHNPEKSYNFLDEILILIKTYNDIIEHEHIHDCLNSSLSINRVIDYEKLASIYDILGQDAYNKQQFLHANIYFNIAIENTLNTECKIKLYIKNINALIQHNIHITENMVCTNFNNIDELDHLLSNLQKSYLYFNKAKSFLQSTIVSQNNDSYELLVTSFKYLLNYIDQLENISNISLPEKYYSKINLLKVKASLLCHAKHDLLNKSKQTHHLNISEKIIINKIKNHLNLNFIESNKLIKEVTSDITESSKINYKVIIEKIEKAYFQFKKNIDLYKSEDLSIIPTKIFQDIIGDFINLVKKLEEFNLPNSLEDKKQINIIKFKSWELYKEIYHFLFAFEKHRIIEISIIEIAKKITNIQTEQKEILTEILRQQLNNKAVLQDKPIYSVEVSRQYEQKYNEIQASLNSVKLLIEDMENKYKEAHKYFKDSKLDESLNTLPTIYSLYKDITRNFTFIENNNDIDYLQKQELIEIKKQARSNNFNAKQLHINMLIRKANNYHFEAPKFNDNDIFQAKQYYSQAIKYYKEAFSINSSLEQNNNQQFLKDRIEKVEEDYKKLIDTEIQKEIKIPSRENFKKKNISPKPNNVTLSEVQMNSKTLRNPSINKPNNFKIKEKNNSEVNLLAQSKPSFTYNSNEFPPLHSEELWVTKLKENSESDKIAKNYELFEKGRPRGRNGTPINGKERRIRKINFIKDPARPKSQLPYIREAFF